MKITPCEFKLSERAMLMVRSVCAADAEMYARFKRMTYTETYFLALYPEECLHYNIKNIRQSLEMCTESSVNFEIGAFDKEKQVGGVGVYCVNDILKNRHRATVGISIEQGYWGCGLGRFLMRLAIKQAKANGFEQLELGVYSDNIRAIHLYEKFGFERCGVQPHAFKLKDGTYRDEIMMVKML